MGVIVVLRALSGLTVSESNIEITCLSKLGIPAATTIFSGDGAVQVYNQTNELVYLGGRGQPQCRSVQRGQPAHAQRIVQLP